MNFLFRPIDIASLAFFRICFGILAFADIMGQLTYYHWYKSAFQPDAFHFRYYGFDWVRPFPEPLMSLFLISLLVAAILVALGRYYKQMALYFAFGFTYMFLVEKGHYLNHGYLFCVLSFIMVLLPAHRNYSWDSLKNPSIKTEKIPYYPLFILQFCMGFVYFMGGIAKLNKDWLNAMPLKIWLPYKKDYFLIGPILEQEWLAWFMSYGGVFLDLCVVPLLIFKRTRIFALCCLVFFHLTNVMIFQIGIFPWLSICLSLLFFTPSFPRQVGNWLQKRFSIFIKMEEWWEKKSNHRLQSVGSKHTQESIKIQPIKIGEYNYYLDSWSDSKKQGITFLIITFCIINLLLPLRHHYFKGDVAWTEEGHRYAWRMMLRHKQGSGHFEVKNLSNNTSKKVFPKKELPKKLGYKLFTHPDMILQYAHHLRDQYQTEWKTDSVAVFAHIRCKLNGRKYQQFINPKTDLAKEEWSFLKESDWIVPLKEK